LLQDAFHGDADMAFIIDTFSVADHQDLGGFMPDVEDLGYAIGYGAVGQEVQVIEIDIGGRFRSIQSAFDHSAGGTAGTVFKYYLGPFF